MPRYLNYGKVLAVTDCCDNISAPHWGIFLPGRLLTRISDLYFPTFALIVTSILYVQIVADVSNIHIINATGDILFGTFPFACGARGPPVSMFGLVWLD